jgi:hypothetical protein
MSEPHFFYNYNRIFVLLFHTSFYMCKGHHGGLGETTTLAQQEVACDKTTCNKRQTHKQPPVMKVDHIISLVLTA